MICLGSTFSYNLTNEEVAETLINFRKHLRPGGQLVIDVLNAIAFTGPRPFQIRTQHKFSRKGVQATATIRHRMNLKLQTMQEQVTWSTIGERGRARPRGGAAVVLPAGAGVPSRCGGIRRRAPDGQFWPHQQRLQRAPPHRRGNTFPRLRSHAGQSALRRLAAADAAGLR